MQIQIISADSQNVTRLAVAEHKAGQAAVKHVVQPGQKITLLVDGVTLKGGQVVGSKKLKLVKSDKNLVIETEDGTEQIVELSDFFEQKDNYIKVTDVIEYETPFGVFGKLFDKLLLKKHLTNFIVHRNAVLKNLAEKQTFQV